MRGKAALIEVVFDWLREEERSMLVRAGRAKEPVKRRARTVVRVVRCMGWLVPFGWLLKGRVEKCMF